MRRRAMHVEGDHSGIGLRVVDGAGRCKSISD